MSSLRGGSHEIPDPPSRCTVAPVPPAAVWVCQQCCQHWAAKQGLAVDRVVDSGLDRVNDGKQTNQYRPAQCTQRHSFQTIMSPRHARHWIADCHIVLCVATAVRSSLSNNDGCLRSWGLERTRCFQSRPPLAAYWPPTGRGRYTAQQHAGSAHMANHAAAPCCITTCLCTPSWVTRCSPGIKCLAAAAPSTGGRPEQSRCFNTTDTLPSGFDGAPERIPTPICLSSLLLRVG